jgi:glutamate formiminotransferase
VKEAVLPERAPDIGGPGMHPSAGATVIGARPFLVAFNVNLRSTDIDAARAIARKIRASNGGLSHVKAVGIDLAARGMVQVSINVTDHHANPLHVVYEAVRSEAAARGIEVAESEIYGLVPADALIAAAAQSLKLAGFDPAQVLDLRLLDLAGTG